MPGLRNSVARPNPEHNRAGWYHGDVYTSRRNSSEADARRIYSRGDLAWRNRNLSKAMYPYSGIHLQVGQRAERSRTVACANSGAGAKFGINRDREGCHFGVLIVFHHLG